ncbi:MAG: methyltransferase domain-containing protein [Patescibacteria group bacterium]
MKNRNFFYLQYNKIDWKNQEKTKINSFIYDIVIKNFILKKKGSNISIFDMGFGIGFFYKILYPYLIKKYQTIVLEGCEPSKKNYNYFKNRPLNIKKSTKLKTHKKTFLNTETNRKFDFITSIYVFPHFLFNDLEKTVKKIYSMLNEKGKFILILAEEKYLKRKLKTEKDLFIENNIVSFKNKKYKEILHYSDIPKIGKLIDYNREEKFYVDLFKKNKFKLLQKKNLDDSGFICTLFVFEKN